MKFEAIKHKSFVVLGAKRSGLAAAMLLKRLGIEVFVSDISKSLEPGIVEALNQNEIAFECGRHSEKALEADVVVISPGIPTNAPIIRQLTELGKTIVSEIELASWFCKCRCVAVTGTDGKTTVTSLIHHILSLDAKVNGYKVKALGNIGQAFSEHVAQLDENDVAVLEISSFQLDFCRSFKPDIAIITNIAPDHLDRYDNDIRKYEASKYKITKNQTSNDWLIYNHDNERLRRHFERNATRAQKMAFGLSKETLSDFKNSSYIDNEDMVFQKNNQRETVMNASDIASPNFRGKHNIYNAIAAAAAARLMQIRSEVIREGIRTFKGVEHRLEFVRTLAGVEYINDSKATTINALTCALEAIRGDVVLIMGGRDKGNDYSTITSIVKQKVRVVIAIGEAKNAIKNTLGQSVDVRQAASLDDAVKLARELSVPGNSVLLSPSCASFDMFSSYEERGKAFKSLVAEL